MVKNLTSLTGSGVKDFFLQRLSALVLGAFVIFLVVFCFMHAPMSYAIWTGLFAHLWMKLFTLLALLSLIVHAWVGIWTIFTDYIHCSILRGLLLVLVILGFLACFAWGIMIVWGA